MRRCATLWPAHSALLSAVFLPWSFRPSWRLTTRTTTLGRWLLWFLLFRLMIESGVVTTSRLAALVTSS